MIPEGAHPIAYVQWYSEILPATGSAAAGYIALCWWLGARPFAKATLEDFDAAISPLYDEDGEA